jgi:hypothetical protein
MAKPKGQAAQQQERQPSDEGEMRPKPGSSGTR